MYSKNRGSYFKSEDKERERERLKRLSGNFAAFRDLRQQKNEMERRLMNVKLKKYKPIKNDNRVHAMLMMFLLGLLVVFTAHTINSYVSDKAVIVYCDTYGWGDDCTRCPDGARCAKGKILQCPKDYLLKDNECVLNEELILLRKDMMKEIKTVLAFKKGSKLCFGGSENSDQIALDDLESYLNRFKSRNEYDQAFDWLKRELSTHTLDYDIRIDYRVDERTGRYTDFISSNYYEYSMLCKIKMFFTSNIKFLLIFVFFFIVIVLYSKVHKQRQKIIRKAEELYKNNLIKLQEEDQISVKNLISFDVSIEGFERDALMTELERIRKIDEQVTKFQRNGELYWVLV